MRNILVIVIIFLVSCDSEEAWDCIQKEGDNVIIEIPFDSTITQLKVFDDVNLVLHSSDTQVFELHTGSNMVSDIEFLLDTGVLHIFNHNVCRWTRSPENVTLHIYSSKLSFIEKQGFGNISSEDTIRHKLRFVTYDPGKINLTLNNPSISLQLFSLTNVKLSGRTQSLGCYINDSRDSRVDAEKLLASHVSITHDGHNDIVVYPINRINYRIWNSGNILLLNEPEVINEIEIIGSGKLIKKF